jgi:type I restriction enzyme S subunit
VAYVSALQSTTDSLRDGKSINYQQFGAIPIPLPTLPEQQTIATFLDRETAKIDALVAEQENLIALLKEKRQAVISHAVTKGLDPTVPMKDSGIEWLGEVPDGWLVTKFGRVAFMQEGPGLRNWQFVEDGIRVICVTNITENGIDFSRLEKFISPEEYVSSYQHFTVENGDILLSSSGNSWGKVAVYDFDEAVILNTSTIRLNQLPDKQLDREYIKLLLQSLLAREQLSLAMTGSCQPNFGPTHLNSLSVLIPTREEQQAIIGFVNGETAKLDTLTAEAQRAIDLLKERRSALISATVTGKIDVRGYRAQPPPII